MVRQKYFKEEHKLGVKVSDKDNPNKIIMQFFKDIKELENEGVLPKGMVEWSAKEIKRQYKNKIMGRRK